MTKNKVSRFAQLRREERESVWQYRSDRRWNLYLNETIIDAIALRPCALRTKFNLIIRSQHSKLTWKYFQINPTDRPRKEMSMKKENGTPTWKYSISSASFTGTWHWINKFTRRNWLRWFSHNHHSFGSTFQSLVNHWQMQWKRLNHWNALAKVCKEFFIVDCWKIFLSSHCTWDIYQGKAKVWLSIWPFVAIKK